MKLQLVLWFTLLAGCRGISLRGESSQAASASKITNVGVQLPPLGLSVPVPAPAPMPALAPAPAPAAVTIPILQREIDLLKAEFAKLTATVASSLLPVLHMGPGPAPSPAAYAASPGPSLPSPAPSPVTGGPNFNLAPAPAPAPMLAPAHGPAPAPAPLPGSAAPGPAPAPGPALSAAALAAASAAAAARAAAAAAGGLLDGMSFQSIDSNSDGKISFDEFKLFKKASAAMTVGGAVPLDGPLKIIFETMDTDVDLFIEASEFDLNLAKGIEEPAQPAWPSVGMDENGQFIRLAGGGKPPLVQAPACSGGGNSFNLNCPDAEQNAAQFNAIAASQALQAVNKASQAHPLTAESIKNAIIVAEKGQDARRIIRESAKIQQEVKVMNKAMNRQIEKGVDKFSREMAKFKVAPPLIFSQPPIVPPVDLTRQ